MRNNDTERVVRIFKLIKILKESSMTTAQLIKSTRFSKDMVYADLDLLRSLGYLPEVSKKGEVHTILGNERKLIFDEKEKKLLSQLLSTDKNNPTSISIKAKLKFHSSLVPSPEELAERVHARNVERLHRAIEEKLSVKLVKYLSSTPGKTAKDRVVWPIEIVEDTAQLVAFEEDSNEQKNFKLQRIVDVEVIMSTKKRPENFKQTTDLFGLAGSEPYTVSLNLSKRAWQLMKEEYPRTTAHLTPQKNKEYPYRFVGEVRDFKGVRRFIMGLPGEIEVEGPPALVTYLKKCIKEYSFSAKTRKG